MSKTVVEAAMHSPGLPYGRYANFFHAWDRLVGVVVLHFVLLVRQVGVVQGYIVAGDDHAVAGASLPHHIMTIVNPHAWVHHLVLYPT